MAEHASPTVEARLVDLALALDAAEGAAPVDLVDAVLARLADPTPTAEPLRPSQRPSVGWAAATVLVLLATALVVAVAPARRAVAGWLGVDGVTVEVVGRLPVTASGPFDADPGLGRPTTLAAARRAVPFAIRVPAALGEPEAYVGRPPGGVTLVWPDDEVVVTQHPGDVAVLAKQVQPGGFVQAVTVEGQPGYWVSGPAHVIDDDGDGPTEPRRAGNTLAWTVDGTTTRIELDGTLPEARALAATLR